MAPFSLQGKTLGKYQVLEPLGRGGMAQVYRAYHPQLDRYLAIKVLRPDLVEDAEFLARFQREARAVAALRHPNIVQIFDFDVEDDIYYMVMELLEGDTLKARLNGYRLQDGCMPNGEMTHILADVLSGLGYAHSQGIIHRDIKPANILLNRNGQAILTDFGIAQIVGGTQYTLTGALMGTVNYMAPEQGLEGRCDARSDLYSLGIVFYEMATGKPPFEGDTPLAVLMKHLHDPLVLPRELNPLLPQAYERVLLKVLTKDPDDRYQNAAEMAQALQGAAAEAGVSPVDAAAEAKKPLPEPGNVVAVFSGAEREHIPDTRFASDDTDIRLGQQLASQAPGLSPTLASAAKQAAQAVFKGFEAADQALQERLAPREADQPAGQAESGKAHPSRVASAAGIFAFTLIGLNLLVVAIGIFTRNWGGFAFGWPFELFLAGFGLSLLMTALSLIWLLLPAGVLVGNGLLLAFYALTGLWKDWGFLWPLEPLLVIGVLGLTFRLARQPGGSRGLARRMGTVMAVFSASCGVLTLGASWIVAMIR